MARIIKFDPRGGDEPSKKGSGGKETPRVVKAEAKNRKGKPEPLTKEEFEKLLEPLREGLKRLYPSQVEEVLGFSGLGEKNGDRVFLVGALMWKRYGTEQPLLSTFVALFERGRLEQISFLEAKNNYWDWRTMIKLLKKDFHTEELFNRFMELVGGRHRV
ncbi:MAG: RtcB family protein [Aquificae bacterium]|nr:RtcB family protein [Aquificota bacterium]